MPQRDAFATLSDDEWLSVLIASMSERHQYGQTLPGFPSVALQRETVGADGETAIRHAWAFANEATRRFRVSPLFVNSGKTLLDFGCCWGRISRCFLRDFAPDRIIGVDVSAKYLDQCRELFAGPRYLLIDKEPPTPIESDSVDFIVGFSVFSHLPERLCHTWIAEFARLLRPGGRVALTTRGRRFFDVARGSSDPSKRLATMFEDFDAAKASYDRGELVFANPRGFDRYGETFIPEKYARERLAGGLRFVGFHDHDVQPIMFFEL